ncbi:hypothetical protein CBL_13049 [Carabus blaptoides fortunei]
MEKLNIILITIYLVKIYQCTSNQTSNKENFLTNSVETHKSSFQLPKVIENTGFDITFSSKQNNINETIKQDYENRPVFNNKGNYLLNFSSEWNNSKNNLQSGKSKVKNIVGNYRNAKNSNIDNTNGNFDSTDDKDTQTEIPNMNEPEENITEINITTKIENSDKIENVLSQKVVELENNITYNVSEPSKIKVLNITANLEITLQNNLHKILGSLKAEKGKYLLPHLMEKFESTVLRPIKDSLETIHIELSPEYNNNYGSQIQPNTPLFLQKLQEKKQKILNHFGIRCCNYDYPYPY